MKFETLLAFCFNVRREQFHYWKCFADGPSGVCIEFRRQKLLAAIKGKENFRRGPVDYREIDDVEKITPPVKEWAFSKRITYRDENLRASVGRQTHLKLAKFVRVPLFGANGHDA